MLPEVSFDNAFKLLAVALLNSIWIFAILWLLYKYIAGSIMRTSRGKHNAALLLLCAGTGIVALSFILGANFNFRMESLPVFKFSEKSYYNFNTILPYFSAVYLFILFILLARFIYQLYVLNKKQLYSLLAAGDWQLKFIDEWTKKLNIQLRVSVKLSAFIDTPMVSGILKPLILLPVTYANGLSIEQAESILLHELAHIKRNDYLVNIIISIIGILFFFNPFVQLLMNSIKKERENSCDDFVLQCGYIPQDYAKALLILETNRQQRISLAVAAGGFNEKHLLQRVKRIVNQPVKTTSRLSYTIVLVICGLAAGFATLHNYYIKRNTPGITSQAPRVESNLLKLPINKSINTDRDLIVLNQDKGNRGTIKPAKIFPKHERLITTKKIVAVKKPEMAKQQEPRMELLDNDYKVSFAAYKDNNDKELLIKAYTALDILTQVNRENKNPVLLTQEDIIKTALIQWLQNNDDENAKDALVRSVNDLLEVMKKLMDVQQQYERLLMKNREQSTIDTVLIINNKPVIHL